MNTLYVHFILFAREFNLLDPKETAVMDDPRRCCAALGAVAGVGAMGPAAGARGHRTT